MPVHRPDDDANVPRMERSRWITTMSPETRDDTARARSNSVNTSRRWVWRASKETFEEGRVSVLAVLDTLAALLLVPLCLWLFGLTLVFFSLSVTTPVLLLRTARATKRGVDMWNEREDAVARRYRRLGLAPKFGDRVRDLWEHRKKKHEYPVEIFEMIDCRIFPVVISTFLHPLDALRAIPNNWYRQTFCVDFLSPFELVPDIKRSYFLPPVWSAKWVWIWTLALIGLAFFTWWIPFPFWLGFVLLGFLGLAGIPAVALVWFRYAPKMMLFIAAPVAYCAAMSFTNKRTALETVEDLVDIRDSRRSSHPRESVVRFFACLSFASLFIKLNIRALELNIIDWLRTIGLPSRAVHVVDRWLGPGGIPLYEVVGWLSLGLTLLIWWWSRSIHARVTRRKQEVLTYQDNGLRLLLFVRGVLGIWLWPVVAYIAYHAFTGVRWPWIDIVTFFPWQR